MAKCRNWSVLLATMAEAEASLRHLSLRCHIGAAGLHGPLEQGSMPHAAACLACLQAPSGWHQLARTARVPVPCCSQDHTVPGSRTLVPGPESSVGHQTQGSRTHDQWAPTGFQDPGPSLAPSAGFEDP
jgi:hypothetical protein